MGKLTRIHAHANKWAPEQKLQSLQRHADGQATAAEPALWTDEWARWFVAQNLHQLVRAVGDDHLVANDATVWARCLADALELGWYHDDLYGLASRNDPLFVPVDTGKLVADLSNQLRDLGVTVEKSVTRAQDLQTALRMILPRPLDGNWIAWDRTAWNLPRAIPFANGLLDLETLHLRSLTRDDRITWRIPYRWIGGQPLPGPAVRFWLQHFRNLFGDDAEAKLKTRALLVRSAVALAPWIRGAQWQKALMLIGPGQNGKGTWIRLWQRILGPLMQSLSLAAYDDANRFGLTNLQPDTLVAATPDMDENARLRGTERWKKLTGDDPMDWERKHRDIITVQFRARLWLAGPVVPKVTDRSHGMYRRIKDTIILFDRKQPEDPGYEDVMSVRENIETLLVLAVTPLHRVVTGQEPMPVPASAVAALEEYRRQIDPWRQWIDPDDGWLILDPTGWVETDRLYVVYKRWYQYWTGERFPEYMPRQKFGRVLTEHLGMRVGRGSGSDKGYRGVRIHPHWDRRFDD
ncbi:MAG: hypothetical protein C7B45_03485 [Sulfobacillus acidophilus]|uniref:SF3 helicase domain-containing protein n=1 Tax=Sulfobacillus acidophilus TaxID=53633 RepID=A0A2T2WME0_9FIRM|nr:MAG: hypothetical protein C7B45_03485 [Sulfobacillus acidophilus]